MTDDLVAFINARLDEDEQAARASHYEGQRWLAEEEGVSRWPDDEPVHMADTKKDARHIALHDPARVLRGVEAKRQVLTVHRPGKEVPEWSSAVGRFTTVSCEGCGFGGPCDDPHTEDINECPTLQALATEWSDHPDYDREHWATETDLNP